MLSGGISASQSDPCVSSHGQTRHQADCIALHQFTSIATGEEGDGQGLLQVLGSKVVFRVVQVKFVPRACREPSVFVKIQGELPNRVPKAYTRSK